LTNSLFGDDNFCVYATMLLNCFQAAPKAGIAYEIFICGFIDRRMASDSPSASRILACLMLRLSFDLSARFWPSAAVSVAVAKSMAAIFSFSA